MGGGVPDQTRYAPPVPGTPSGTRQVHPPRPGTSPQDQAGTPPDQVHPPPPQDQAGTPPGPDRYTPQDQAGTPQDQAGTPLDQAGTPPGTRQVHPPPGPGRYPPTPGPGRYNPLSPEAANSRIRSTIGRYASYWNAFLFCYISCATINANCQKITKNSNESAVI